MSDPGLEPASTTEVTELLTAQHRRLESLLKELLDSAAPVDRAALLGCAGDELALHISAEETVFYPAVHALRTEDILLESLEEHLSLKRLLADLLALAPNDATFQAKCKVLEEQARHHHGEEEQHLFPEVKRLFHAELRKRLAQQVRAHQDGLRASARPPREEVGAWTDAAEPLP